MSLVTVETMNSPLPPLPTADGNLTTLGVHGVGRRTAGPLAFVTLILIVYPFPTADLSATNSGSLATIAVTTS